MEKIILKATPREIVGKKVKKIRSERKIPANLFGRGFDNVNLTIDKREFEKVFRKAGSSTIVDLEIEGNGNEKILIHEPQLDPVSDEIIHADLYKVNMKEEIHTEIPLEFIGFSPAVEDLEGNLITSKDSLEVKCLPDKLVSEIQVDISILKTFDDLIKVGDIKIPEGVEVLDEIEEIVAQVTPPRSEEELEEMEQDTAQEEKAAVENLEAQAEAEKTDKEEGTEAPAEEPQKE